MAVPRRQQALGRRPRRTLCLLAALIWLCKDADSSPLTFAWKGRPPRGELWQDLRENPQQWLDMRQAKAAGHVNPRYPDFKHGEKGDGLWVDDAKRPAWAMTAEGLEELRLAAWSPEVAKAAKAAGDKDLESRWRSVFEQPELWRDCREDKEFGKLKPKHPDFKHKQEDISLWLNDARKFFPWVTEKLATLPTVRSAVKVGEGELLESLFDEPWEWVDCRRAKVGGKFAAADRDVQDFLHISSGHKLWVSAMPDDAVVKVRSADLGYRPRWSLWELPQERKERIFEEFRADPSEWTDHRADKAAGLVKKTYPDFKRRRTDDAIWIEGPEQNRVVAELERAGRLRSVQA